MNPRFSGVDWRSFWTALDYFSRTYLLGLFLLLMFGVLQAFWFHWKLVRATTDSSTNPRVVESQGNIEFSFAKALRLAFALGLALFANQLMRIVYLIAPLMHNYEGVWSVPEFFLICQMCFFPLVSLLILEWSMTAHVRRLTRSR